jgi:ribosome-binding factor A
MARRDHASARDYPRTARVTGLVLVIVGAAPVAFDAERVERLAVTSVVVEPDLRHATVYFDTFEGGEADDEAIEVLQDVRVRLQRAIGDQARLKRTPELTFRPDPAVRRGERIDEILRHIQTDES